MIKITLVDEDMFPIGGIVPFERTLGKEPLEFTVIESFVKEDIYIAVWEDDRYLFKIKPNCSGTLTIGYKLNVEGILS